MSKELLEKLKQKENFISSFTLSPPTDDAKKKKITFNKKEFKDCAIYATSEGFELVFQIPGYNPDRNLKFEWEGRRIISLFIVIFVFFSSGLCSARSKMKLFSWKGGSEKGEWRLAVKIFHTFIVW